MFVACKIIEHTLTSFPRIYPPFFYSRCHLLFFFFFFFFFPEIIALESNKQKEHLHDCGSHMIRSLAEDRHSLAASSLSNVFLLALLPLPPLLPLFKHDRSRSSSVRSPAHFLALILLSPRFSFAYLSQFPPISDFFRVSCLLLLTTPPSSPPSFPPFLLPPSHPPSCRSYPRR